MANAFKEFIQGFQEAASAKAEEIEGTIDTLYWDRERFIYDGTDYMDERSRMEYAEAMKKSHYYKSVELRIELYRSVQVLLRNIAGEENENNDN